MANLTDSSAHAIEANAYTEAELDNLLVVARALPMLMFTDGDSLKRAGVSLTALQSLLEQNIVTPADFKLYTEDTMSLLLLKNEALRRDVNSIESGAAGLRFVFSSSTAAADPGDGKFRFDNASPLSAGSLYVDNLDTEGATVSSFIDSWDDVVNAGSRGTLVIRGVTDPTDFLVANVTGTVTDSTGYRTVTISPVSGSGAFTNGETYLLLFAPAGADGAAGVGDVSGPGSSTDGNLASFNGTGGKTIQDSGIAAANVYRAGGTDVAIVDGGTGASSASAAFTALKQAATTSATGVVEKSTSAENTVGTSDTVYPSVAGVKEMISAFAAAPATRLTPATPTGSAPVEWTAGIPSGASEITLGFDGISPDGANSFLVQIGDSGGFETSGYQSYGSLGGAAFNATTGFGIYSGDAGYAHYGSLSLRRTDGNLWIASGLFAVTGAGNNAESAGRVLLSGDLDRIRVTATSGNLANAGTLSVLIR